MSRSTQNMRGIAKRLTRYETAGNELSEPNAPARFIVCEKMRHPLVALAGINGYRSLLSRALVLAGEEARWLGAVRIKADGSLERPTETVDLDQQEITHGEVLLVAELLGLLVTFIGESLTLSLVREVWPRAPINDRDSNKKDSITQTT